MLPNHITLVGCWPTLCPAARHIFFSSLWTDSDSAVRWKAPADWLLVLLMQTIFVITSRVHCVTSPRLSDNTVLVLTVESVTLWGWSTMLAMWRYGFPHVPLALRQRLWLSVTDSDWFHRSTKLSIFCRYRNNDSFQSFVCDEIIFTLLADPT